MSKSKNRGEKNGQAKLTLEAVQVIRHLLSRGHSSKEIATVYGISFGLVSGIRNNKLWATVEEQPVIQPTNNNKFKGRPYRDEDIQIITKEVEFLLAGGYRANEKDRILSGLEKALEDSPVEDWRKWTGMKLMHVIDALYELGEPG